MTDCTATRIASCTAAARWVYSSVMGRAAVGLVAVMLVSACGGKNVSSAVAREPEFAPAGQTKCKVRASQNKPLVVEWPSADRAQLEAKAKSQVVVARYDGCEMEILPHCSAPGAYRYTGVTPKQDTVSIRNVDELYATVPVGAARLEGKLAAAGQLTVEMTTVGRLESDHPLVNADELEGRCSGATHVLTGLTVGAFEFFAGAQAEVGAEVGVGNAGAGARSQTQRETLTRDGSPDACEVSEDAAPTECSALLRIEVAKLGVPRPRTPTCPAGSEWDGEGCVHTTVVKRVVCPKGSTLEGDDCVLPVAAAAHEATPATTTKAGVPEDLWDDEQTGEGWYCYAGELDGKRFGECDRDQIECGVTMGNRKKKGLKAKAQRCEKQASASCFQVRRAKDRQPRSFCFPEKGLCTATQASTKRREDIELLTTCETYR